MPQTGRAYEMPMDKLYEHMKKALDTFDLRFSEMDKVSVLLGPGLVVFEYDGMQLSFNAGV